MLRDGTMRAPSMATLALAMTMLCMPATTQAATWADGDDLPANMPVETFEIAGEGSSEDDGRSNGVTSTRRVRLPLLDVLGTAAVGGIVLHQLREDPRPTPTLTATAVPRGETAEIAGESLELAQEHAALEVAAVVTPEPGTVLLLATGLTALAVLVYRRSRRVCTLPDRSSHRRRR